MATPPVLDQSQTLYDYGLSFATPNFPIAQSFTAGITGKLDTIEILYNGPIEGAATFMMEIRDGDGLKGTLLGAQYVLGQTYENNFFFVSLDVSGMGVQVAAGHQYTFEFIGYSGPGNSGERGPIFYSLNAYAGGRLYSPSGYGDDTVDWDLTFKTFVTPSTTSPVPEPDSVSMLLIGLAAMAGLIRANKRT